VVIVASATVVACKDGEITLATAEPKARLLGAIDGRVYWANGPILSWIGDGMDRPLSGDPGGADWARRGNFAMDGRGVYYSHHNKASFLDIAPRKEPRPPFATSDSWMRPAGEHPTGVAIDGQCVYTLALDVECRDRGAIVALPRGDTGRCQERPAQANGLQPGEFAMDADHFYWVDGSCLGESPTAGHVKALPRGAGPVVVIADHEASPPVELRAGQRGIYWMTRDGIRVAGASPFAAPTTLVAGAVEQLVVDRGSIFYVAGGSVHWLREGAHEPRPAVIKTGVREIAVDHRFLYALTPAGDITRSPRPD